MDFPTIQLWKGYIFSEYLLVINFLEACEHVEEDEVFLIQEIIRYLGNSWELQPFEEMKYNGENVKFSRLLPTYYKKLVKNKNNA